MTADQLELNKTALWRDHARDLALANTKLRGKLWQLRATITKLILLCGALAVALIGLVIWKVV